MTIPPWVADSIDRAIAPWRAAIPTARWVPVANWHVTLQFLGWTEQRVMPWVHEQLTRAVADMPAFETHASGLGAFPSGRRARVLWAGIDDPDARFAALAGTVHHSLGHEFPPERRSFTPHVTVARSDPPLVRADGFAGTPLESDPFTVDEVVLMRSHLRRPAPVYEPMGSFRLA